MLLTISTTHQPATDLGYLLHKNPARLQTEELSFGKGFVFYLEASVEKCTAALLIEIDPVALVRGCGPSGEGGQLEQYVNDRTYAANWQTACHSWVRPSPAKPIGRALPTFR
jgi:RNA repair, ligase-Pnkp-associating, region of Hen1